MSRYAHFDSEDAGQIATTKGWGDVGRWSQNLKPVEFPQIIHLCDHGWSQSLAALAREFPAAMKTAKPEKTVMSTIAGMMKMLDENSKATVLTIGDGTGASQRSLSESVTSALVESNPNHDRLGRFASGGGRMHAPDDGGANIGGAAPSSTSTKFTKEDKAAGVIEKPKDIRGKMAFLALDHGKVFDVGDDGHQEWESKHDALFNKYGGEKRFAYVRHLTPGRGQYSVPTNSASDIEKVRKLEEQTYGDPKRKISLNILEPNGNMVEFSITADEPDWHYAYKQNRRVNRLRESRRRLKESILLRLAERNPYHDKLGRFASAGSAASMNIATYRSQAKASNPAALKDNARKELKKLKSDPKAVGSHFVELDGTSYSMGKQTHIDWLASSKSAKKVVSDHLKDGRLERNDKVLDDFRGRMRLIQHHRWQAGKEIDDTFILPDATPSSFAAAQKHFNAVSQGKYATIKVPFRGGYLDYAGKKTADDWQSDFNQRRLSGTLMDESKKMKRQKMLLRALGSLRRSH